MGCKKRRWTPVLERKNKITATISVRSKHFAEIEIPFTADKYSIIYRSSKNLDYSEKNQLIHRNYNKWIHMLQSSIQREFTEAAQGK